MRLSFFMQKHVVCYFSGPILALSLWCSTRSAQFSLSREDTPRGVRDCTGLYRFGHDYRAARRGVYGIVRDCTDSDTITGRPAQHSLPRVVVVILHHLDTKLRGVELEPHSEWRKSPVLVRVK